MLDIDLFAYWHLVTPNNDFELLIQNICHLESSTEAYQDLNLPGHQLQIANDFFRLSK